MSFLLHGEECTWRVRRRCQDLPSRMLGIILRAGMVTRSSWAAIVAMLHICAYYPWFSYPHIGQSVELLWQYNIVCGARVAMYAALPK